MPRARMNGTAFRRIGVTITALSLASSGCVEFFTPTRTVDHQAKPSAQKAYVYGRFRLTESGATSAARHVASQAGLGFVLGCADGNTYTISFIGNYPTLFEVSPSTCALAHVLYVVNRQVVDAKPLPSALRRGFKLEAGHAYYLGDIVLDVHNQMREDTWRLRSMTDDYERTTQEMLSYWPDFGGLPRVKALLFEGMPPGG